MHEVIKFIYDLNLNNKCIVVAVSGGPDSMFLLNLLLQLRNKLNLKIVVAHVNHKLRTESDEEEKKVKEFCKKNELIFELKVINKFPNDKFSEASARKIRYEFFDKIVEKYNSNVLFTAHHGDDLIETILMRIVRGSNVKGYAGFQRLSIDRGYKIARPLVFMSKEEIKKYLDENSIWYANDMSNESDMYTRNRYRKYILPELKKENKNINKKILEFNEKILLVDNYLKKLANKKYKQICENKVIDIKKFNKLDEIIKDYILQMYLNSIYGDKIDKITYKHLNIIKKYILTNKNVVFDLPYNKKAIIEYNNFKVINNNKREKYEYLFHDSIILPNGKKIYIDNDTKLTSNFVIHLNSNEIKLPFHVRNKKDGDKIKVKNMPCTKKVNDIFTNSKIPKEQRDTYPIVTDDSGEIIWIPGIKKSHLDRKKEQKYDIILKYD